MTKAEALGAMSMGHRVTHDYFTSNEWKKLDGGHYEFEDGCRCTPSEFWRWRDDLAWETGWSIFK